VTTAEFISIVIRNPINRAILERLPMLALPDAWLVSGALFQTVWNIQSDFPPEHGIRDYDIFYFDKDLTWQAEDVAIHRAAQMFEDLQARIEVRNQARVHLWFEAKFGAPYPPLSRATDGIDRFLQINAMVGVRNCGDRFDTYAPHGFDDIVNMKVRPNITANFQRKRYEEKAMRWSASWPRLVLEPG
jgi:hypothetical protein